MSASLARTARASLSRISLTAGQAVPASEKADTHAHARRPEKSFALHIGGDLQLPTRRPQPTAATPAATPRPRDPFDGVPLRAWAERLGERVMPAYEAVKAEDARRKAEARAAGESGPAPAAVASAVPHFLPFTRWAAASPAVRSTLVVDEPKTRKKARLSWYHPDDTMVPRDWFKGGLLADLAYYRPFQSAPAA